jgi:multisubunit Na+/H+ antiporter MnhG subunit
MIHWKKVTLGLIFTLFGFLAWFIAELIEDFFVFLHEQLLIICFFLLFMAQIVYLYALRKKVTKSGL